jgi:hypothetical protein
MNTARPLVNDETIDRRLTAYLAPGFVMVAPSVSLQPGDEDPLLRLLRAPKLWQMIPLYLVDAEVASPVYLLYPFNINDPLRTDLSGRQVPPPHRLEMGDWVVDRLVMALNAVLTRLQRAKIELSNAWVVDAREGYQGEFWVTPENPPSDLYSSYNEYTADRIRRHAYALGVPPSANQWAMRPRAGSVLEAQARAGEVTWVRG